MGSSHGNMVTAITKNPSLKSYMGHAALAGKRVDEWRKGMA